MVLTPKSLLRHPEARSSFDEVKTGTSFTHVIGDDLIENNDSVRKVIICTGKVYYDLVKYRAERKLDDVIAIVRIEQLCPFPYNLVNEQVSKYSKAKVGQTST